MSRRINTHQKGSALIITILLVTVLSAIAFSTSRLTISEIVQTGQLEDSELAYQSAEGCIETGLLLYRYNRNSEVPTGVTDGMSEDVQEYVYFDVTDGAEIDKPAFDSKDPAKSYCTLRMWHKNDAGEAEEVDVNKCNQEKFNVGLCTEVPSDKLNEVCGTDYGKCYEDNGAYYIVPALVQDDSVEYSIEYDVSGVDSINLTWDYLEEPLSFAEFCSKYPDKCLMDEYRNYFDSFKILYLPIDADGGVDLDQKLVLDYSHSFSQSGVAYPISVFDAQKIRLKPFGGSLKTYNIETDDTTYKIDSRYTVIESTGYYGSTKRKLKTVLDRKTQSMLSTYDFLLYSSEAK